jgi:hypothetical protein
MGYSSREAGIEGLITVNSTNASGQAMTSLVSPDAPIYLVQETNPDAVDNGGLALDGKRVAVVGTLPFFVLLVAGCAETAGNRNGVKVQSVKEGLWGEVPKSLIQDQNAVPAGQIQIGDVAKFTGKTWVLQPNDTGFALGAKLRAVNADGSESYMYVPAKSVEQKGKQLVFAPETQAVVWTGKLKSGDKVFTIAEVETANFARSEVDVLGEVSADSLRLGTGQLSVQMLGENREALLNIPAPYLGRASSLTVGMTFEDLKDYLGFDKAEQAYLKDYYDQLAAFDKKVQEQAAAKATTTPSASPTAVATATAASSDKDRSNGQHTAVQASPLDGLVKLVDSYRVESAMVLLAVIVLAIVALSSIKTSKDRKASEERDAAAEQKLREVEAKRLESEQREHRAEELHNKTLKGLDLIEAMAEELDLGAEDLEQGTAGLAAAAEQTGAELGRVAVRHGVRTGVASQGANVVVERTKRKAGDIKKAVADTRTQIS